MAPGYVQRKLTTILAADVEGYSRLMGVDDEATLKTLMAYREIIQSLITRHGGRLTGTAGDSVLAEFASAVEAVRCAVEIQEELAGHNAQRPADWQMRFRIGVNIGDVMVEEGDLLGDGVNVAARLQSLAEPGGICISGTVYDQIKNKISLTFDALGPQKVKNIAEPVPTYRVVLGSGAGQARAGGRISRKSPGRKLGLAAGVALVIGLAGITLWKFYPPRAVPLTDVSPDVRMALPLPDKPSIGVLPFTNLSADREQEYFVDGLTEAVTIGLSKVEGLFVIDRNSTFTYKGKPVKVQRVAEELGVRYVMDGSVQKAENRVRINVRLVDAIKGSHLWAERYDRVLEDIFSIQDDITQRIVASLEVRLRKEERARLLRRWTSDVKAYEYLLRGREVLLRHTKEDNGLAREMFQKAVEQDPRSAAAWAFLGLAHFQAGQNRWSENPLQSIQQADELARKAISLDDSFSGSYILLANLHLRNREYTKGITLVQKAMLLEPNASGHKALLARILRLSGRPEETVSLLKEAMRLDPHYPNWYLWNLGHAYRLMGRPGESIDAFKESLARGSSSVSPHIGLALAYGQGGQWDEARRQVAEILKINPHYSLKFRRETSLIADPGQLERELEILRKAGLPD